MVDGLYIFKIDQKDDPRLNGFSTILRPADLSGRRGVDLSQLSDVCAYADELLGFAVFRPGRQPTRFIKKLLGGGGSLALSLPEGVANYSIAINEDIQETASALKEGEASAPTPWYVDRLGGWPTATGDGQCIAILDTGVVFGSHLLPRKSDHSDFCDCSRPGSNTYESNGHGTSCAGTAGGFRNEPMRMTPAQRSRIVVARIWRNASRTLVDILMMMSWAVHGWDVRVVSMSFNEGEKSLHKQSDPDMIGRAAQRLRSMNRALVFSSARGYKNGLGYPARTRGVVAVQGYVRAKQSARPDAGPISVVPLTSDAKREHWCVQQDVFIAPAERLISIDRHGEQGTFSGLSAACAFVAGVAALYFERYQSYTVEQVLSQMKVDAERIVDTNDPSHVWLGITFPRSSARSSPQASDSETDPGNGSASR